MLQFVDRIAAVAASSTNRQVFLLITSIISYSYRRILSYSYYPTHIFQLISSIISKMWWRGKRNEIDFWTKYCSTYLLFYFLLLINVFWTHFLEVRLLMSVRHWSLFRSCSFSKFKLASSSCMFLLQDFLGLPGGRRPDTSICWVFPKISDSSPLTTCSNHRSLLPLSTAPNSLTPHLPATSKLLTRSLQVSCEYVLVSFEMAGTLALAISKLMIFVPLLTKYIPTNGCLLLTSAIFTPLMFFYTGSYSLVPYSR